MCGADLQSLLFLVESEGLSRELSKLKMSVVSHVASVGLHHLLVVVSSLGKKVGLVLGYGPKVKLRPSHILQLLDYVVQSYVREGEVR